jgi:hypothetical protein
MKIQYDIPIRVTRDQYNYLTKNYSGILAGRIDEKGQHWIKVWYMAYASRIEKYLETQLTIDIHI